MTRDDLPREIRERLDDPIALANALNLTQGSKRQAGGLLVHCPAHRENTPSCSITRGPDRTVRARCFGCGFTGDALTLIAAVYGRDIDRDFGTVLELAAEIAGIDVDSDVRERRPVPPAPARSEPASPPPVEAATFDALVRPLGWSGRLDGRSGSAPVTGYLERRGLLDLARADGWFSVWPGMAALLVAVFGIELVQRAGLVDHRGELRHPENALAIPWRNEDGLVITLQRRRLDDAKPKYVFPVGLPRPSVPYGADRLAAASNEAELVIVEGAVDVLARRAVDPARVVLGIPGCEGWRREWAEIGRGRVVRVALDADEAGDRAAAKIAADLHDAGAREVLRSTPARGKDWGELVEGRA